MKLKNILLTLSMILPLVAMSNTIITEANGTFAGLGYARSHDFPVEAHIFTVKISDADPNGMRSIDVEVSVNDLHTGNGMRDTHMRMSILDRKNHPWITFKSKIKMPEFHAGTVSLPGQLQINGISKAYNLKLKLKKDDASWHATGSFLIIPTDFDLPLVGMGPMKLLDKVELDLAVRF